MARLIRYLRPRRQPAHMHWLGDLLDGWATCWEPDPRGQIR